MVAVVEMEPDLKQGACQNLAVEQRSHVAGVTKEGVSDKKEKH